MIIIVSIHILIHIIVDTMKLYAESVKGIGQPMRNVLILCNRFT